MMYNGLDFEVLTSFNWNSRHGPWGYFGIDTIMYIYVFS